MLVVDTGPPVATADRADKDHAACRALLEGDDGPLVTTGMVIAEAAYLIDRQLGPAAEAALYASITSGQLEVAGLDLQDCERIRELVSTCADLQLGGTDASVITLAERLGPPGSPPSTTATSGSSPPPRRRVRVAALIAPRVGCRQIRVTALSEKTHLIVALAALAALIVAMVTLVTIATIKCDWHDQRSVVASWISVGTPVEAR